MGAMPTLDPLSSKLDLLSNMSKPTFGYRNSPFARVQPVMLPPTIAIRVGVAIARYTVELIARSAKQARVIPPTEQTNSIYELVQRFQGEEYPGFVRATSDSR